MVSSCRQSGYHFLQLHPLCVLLPQRPPPSQILHLPIPSPLLLPLLPLLPSPAVPPPNLLLQHNAVHARLEQRKHQARLALQLAQPVEDLGRRLRREVVEDGRELCTSRHVSQRGGQKEGVCVCVGMVGAPFSCSPPAARTRPARPARSARARAGAARGGRCRGWRGVGGPFLGDVSFWCLRGGRCPVDVDARGDEVVLRRGGWCRRGVEVRSRVWLVGSMVFLGGCIGGVFQCDVQLGCAKLRY